MYYEPHGSDEEIEQEEEENFSPMTSNHFHFMSMPQFLTMIQFHLFITSIFLFCSI